jgi:hypothetical protein
MALWGNRDSKTASGTLAIASNGAVTGSSTTFTTQARVGDYIVVAGEHYQIVSIASNTSAQTRAGIAGATLTAVTSGTSYALTEKPAFVTTESTSTSGVHGDITKVFGVDTAEIEAERSQGTPVTHAGWIRRTEGSGGRAGRVFNEVLVAMGSMTGDLEDVKIQDLNIVIGTQPSDLEVEAGEEASFTVAATTVPSGGTITYLWQVSTDGATWNSATGTNNAATYTIASTSGEDGYRYRCLLNATGATQVVSSIATLTVTA